MARGASIIGIIKLNPDSTAIGYHIIDEPHYSQFKDVAAIAKAYRKADNTHYVFANLFPSYAGSTLLGGSYENYVWKFVKQIGAENLEYVSHAFEFLF